MLVEVVLHGSLIEILLRSLCKFISLHVDIWAEGGTFQVFVFDCFPKFLLMLVVLLGILIHLVDSCQTSLGLIPIQLTTFDIDSW